MIKNLIYIFTVLLFSSAITFAEGDPFTKKLTRNNISTDDQSSIQQPNILKNKTTTILNSSNQTIQNYLLKATALIANSKSSENKSIKIGDVNYKINPFKTAVILADNKEIIAHEGDLLGNKGAIIISIQKDKMLVIQDNFELVFEINNPVIVKKPIQK